MSRKTKSRRSTSSREDPPILLVNVFDVPKVKKPLSLVCGVCGTRGRYKVGTVVLDPVLAKSEGPGVAEKAVGFTRLFRCRECDAGGPWEFPAQTLMHIMAMALGASAGVEDVPFTFASLATFDGRIFQYATGCETHLKALIDREPERAFLWVRLGNLYSHAEQPKLARAAYERALELDPEDIEAHSMFGQLYVETGQPLLAAPHFQAVLQHARDARHVKEKIRRELVRGAIESLLEAHAATDGRISFLPEAEAPESSRESENEVDIVEIREFDLSTDGGLDDLCDVFLEEPRRVPRRPLRRRPKRLRDTSDDWAVPIRREVPLVGRNAPCPCGSGHKYKKCCGR